VEVVGERGRRGPFLMTRCVTVDANGLHYDDGVVPTAEL
jgi:hypothetical protein